MFYKEKINTEHSLGTQGGKHMGCPYYEDFTRNCVQYLPHIQNLTSFSTCESDKYEHCLVYHFLKKEFKCKYIIPCVDDAIKNIPALVKLFVEDDWTIKLFKDIMEKYCTSDIKHTQCENYKLFEKGIHPPLDLLPDGKTIHLADLLFKKKLTVD